MGREGGGREIAREKNRQTKIIQSTFQPKYRNTPFVNYMHPSLSGTADYYVLNLIKGKSVVAPSGSPFEINSLGNSLLVSTPFGISLLWDQGTRIYIRLEIGYREKVAMKFLIIVGRYHNFIQFFALPVLQFIFGTLLSIFSLIFFLLFFFNSSLCILV